MQPGEGVSDQRGHLADQSAAARGELEPVQEDWQVECIGEVAAEGLCQRRFAGSDVAGEDEQRGAVGEQRQRGHVVAVVGARPAFQLVGIGQQHGLLTQPVLDFVETDQALVAGLADGLGQLDNRVEQIVLVAHGLLSS